jgi:hypothetical protein
MPISHQWINQLRWATLIPAPALIPAPIDPGLIQQGRPDLWRSYIGRIQLDSDSSSDPLQPDPTGERTDLIHGSGGLHGTGWSVEIQLDSESSSSSRSTPVWAGFTAIAEQVQGLIKRGLTASDSQQD